MSISEAPTGGDMNSYFGMVTVGVSEPLSSKADIGLNADVLSALCTREEFSQNSLDNLQVKFTHTEIEKKSSANAVTLGTHRVMLSWDGRRLRAHPEILLDVAAISLLGTPGIWAEDWAERGSTDTGTNTSLILLHELLHHKRFARRRTANSVRAGKIAIPKVVARAYPYAAEAIYRHTPSKMYKEEVEVALDTSRAVKAMPELIGLVHFSSQVL